MFSFLRSTPKPSMTEIEEQVALLDDHIGSGNQLAISKIGDLRLTKTVIGSTWSRRN